MSGKYTVERSEATSWTESKRYVIKEGKKEVLRLHDPKEAELVCDYLNKITGSKKKAKKPSPKKEEVEVKKEKKA